MNKAIMETVGFRDQVKLIEENKCTFCRETVNTANGFKDELSFREYRISGLCQNCQT